MILLDTDVCIEILRGNKKVIQERERVSDDVTISFISVGELFYGAYKSNASQKNIKLVETFLLSLPIVQSDREIMEKFGQLKSTLSTSRTLLPDADILIAATCLSKCTALVTGNTAHFKRFDGLRMENWLR